MKQKDINNTPMSKLIYHTVYPNIGIIPERIEEYVATKRLGAISKSSPRLVEEIIEKEKANIERRGASLDSYTFSFRDLEKVLGIAYNNLDKNRLAYLEETNLTFSELIQFRLMCSELVVLYKRRIEKIKKEGFSCLHGYSEQEMLDYYQNLISLLDRKISDYIYQRNMSRLEKYRLFMLEMKEAKALACNNLYYQIRIDFAEYLNPYFDVTEDNINMMKKFNPDFNPRHR